MKLKERAEKAHELSELASGLTKIIFQFRNGDSGIDDIYDFVDSLPQSTRHILK